MDVIKIKNLEIYANHGVFPEENKIGQKFMVSAELYTDFYSAAENDDLDKSIDYGAICNDLTDFMKNNTFKLIETCARKAAELLLDKYSLLKGVKVEIIKPWAPIGLPIETVSVCTRLEWHSAYIAFGSNMGDKKQYVEKAIESLGNSKACVIESVSDYYVTAPYGGVEQDDFLNGVLKLKTYLTPEQLLALLHMIEQEADRKREIHWGPRTLDLDIIFYDNIILDTEEIHIPHIDMHNRTFVLEPLCQIAPYERHPVLNKTVDQLLKELVDKTC